MKFSTSLVALCSAAALAAPGPLLPDGSKPKFETVNGVTYEVFEDNVFATKMQIVHNSGVCETTPGVNQYSGYFSVGTNMHMWFWFFEARNNPTTAPFSTWFNGGPGCSSMIGLLQENGPCQFYNNTAQPQLNKYSYNEYANMLYVDQPVTVGFSYGTDTVTSTVTAAPYVYKLLQAFFKRFPQYTSRDFGIATESYGGHYGPEFAHYIEQQNAAGKGQKINLKALMINNGFYDDLIQTPAYIDFSENNSYRALITPQQAANLRQAYAQNCAPRLSQCTSTTDPSQDAICSSADQVCYQQVEVPILNSANFDVYDIREPSNDPYPPNYFVKYLNKPAVQTKIGAHHKKFQVCSNAAGSKFGPTGDDARPFLETLSEVVQSGVQVLLFAGDADWICNYKGGYDVAQNVTFAQQALFRSTALKPYNVNGVQKGLYKIVGNFAWLQVFEAGHEVPYYQPATALQAFQQTLSGAGLSST